MKATGVVRRLDNLGRLVIPKEIRKQYHIHVGDTVEFFIDQQNHIVIQKFSALSENDEQIKRMCEILSDKLKTEVFFYYDHRIVNEQLSESYELSDSFLREIKKYRIERIQPTLLYKQQDILINGVVVPVMINGDYYGAFFLSEKQHSIKEEEIEYVKLFVQLLIEEYEEH